MVQILQREGLLPLCHRPPQREAFPTLPHRSQFNRLVCSYTQLIEEMALYLAGVLETRECPYEALDSSAMPVRDAKRRGAGWLAGYADIGWSNTLGWYEGFRLLCAVDPSGVIRGFSRIIHEAESC